MSLLIQIVAKEYYQKYGGGGLIICYPPPPSMKYDNIYERKLLSGDIQSEIIQLYKSELFNILLIYLLMVLSRFNLVEFKIYT